MKFDDVKTRLEVQEVGINGEMTEQHDGLRGALDKLAESLNNKAISISQE